MQQKSPQKCNIACDSFELPVAVSLNSTHIFTKDKPEKSVVNLTLKYIWSMTYYIIVRRKNTVVVLINTVV